mgnify:CR=1 FL=1
MLKHVAALRECGFTFTEADLSGVCGEEASDAFKEDRLAHAAFSDDGRVRAKGNIHIDRIEDDLAPEAFAETANFKVGLFHLIGVGMR